MAKDNLQILYAHLGETNAANVHDIVTWLDRVPFIFDTDSREENRFGYFKPRSLDYEKSTPLPRLARLAAVGRCARQIDTPHGSEDIDLLAIMENALPLLNDARISTLSRSVAQSLGQRFAEAGFARSLQLSVAGGQLCTHLIQFKPREGAIIDLRLFVSGNFNGRGYSGVAGWQEAQVRSGLPYLTLKEYTKK